MENTLIRERIASLRKEMQAENIDVYIVLTDDFHGSEYVGDYFKCREFMSGFDGSAGTLVVLADEAGLWTDGRYFIQAAAQLEGTGIDLYKSGEPGVPDIPDLLTEKLSQMSDPVVGFDGRTVSEAYATMLSRRLAKATFAKTQDLVGRVWTDRPEFPHGPAWLLDEKYAGESVASKLAKIRSAMAERGADCHLMAALDDIAWTYNMRGEDIDYNPVALAYSVITRDEAVIYMDMAALSDEYKAILAKDGVSIKPYLDVYEDVKVFDGKVMLDAGTVNTGLVAAVSDAAQVIRGGNPAKALKALKNETEQSNERLAHIKDGVAVTKLCYWLKTLANGQDEMPTEMEVAAKLEEFRQMGEDYIGQSFAPIIATGHHGAIVHYEADEKSNAVLERGNFVLMDTGGHYLQGTTDITRTLAIGDVSEKHKVHYTAVLCGNLNIGGAYFKEGITGTNIDYLARSPLWELGLDYNHGTGHGVGYLLNVHEGPNAIRLRKADVPFAPGMITSNEPGVYLEGEYGIRLENLLLCVPGEEGFLEFETLTMVPFDRDAIMADMLDEKQTFMLNLYHQQVYKTISLFLTEDERKWLEKATAPI